MNSKNNKILHGNSARIDVKKAVIPQFEDCVFNNYSNERDRFGRSYHRLDADAEFDKAEVDANQL